MLNTESSNQNAHRPIVSIEGDTFLIDGQPTYPSRYWNGHKIEGLLLNSRMVQGVFDDENPETRELFNYPDTGVWDPDRNTDEFVAAMPEWAAYGLNSFTLNLQGGSPTGYGNKPWVNSAFTPKGALKPAYMDRLSRILNQAEALKMVVILGFFYFGQDQILEDETAVVYGVDHITDWLLEKGYRNVLIEIANECDHSHYDHGILQAERTHVLINQIKERAPDGYRLLVSTSFCGGRIPTANVVDAADFILLHGNDVKDPEFIQSMVQQTKALPTYRGQPIVFNEDDHYAYEQATNNFKSAIASYASWGFFDFRRWDELDMTAGYQSVPTDWGIQHERKQAFFKYVKEISGV